MFSMFLNFLFPPRCPNCRAYVERRGDFCAPCMRRLVHVHALVRPTEAADVLDGIWAFAHYREAVRDLLRALKYQKRKSALPPLHAVLQAGDGFSHICRIPLPPFPFPLRQSVRGRAGSTKRKRSLHRGSTHMILRSLHCSSARARRHRSTIIRVRNAGGSCAAPLP